MRTALCTEPVAIVPRGMQGLLQVPDAMAALIAAARYLRPIAATVFCGGCLDLAAPWLEKVQAPTLLVVAEADGEVLRYNGAALRAMRCPKRLEVIPHTTWLFEEPGAMASVSAHAAAWFCSHLARAGHP